MRPLLSPWDLPHHPARTLLCSRGVYALLSFDAWTLMLEHGGRYGVGPFNVAHFDLVEWLVPMPSPALYLALVTGAGLYAFVGVTGTLSRLEAALLWALYTLSWMLSLHDSYQHHYLLSWLLGFAILAPTLSVQDCVRSDARIREYSFPLVLGCCAIVYLFTAISKSAPLWLSGAVLRKLAEEGGPMAWGPQALVEIGVEDARAWHFAAISTVLLQLVVALGFLIAYFRDAYPARALAAVSTIALILASSFHVATELTPSFAIGWFSYYMLWIVWVSLLPAEWLARILVTIAHFRTRLRVPRATRARLVLLSLLALACSLSFLFGEDLPGVGWAVLCFSCARLIHVWLVMCRHLERAFALGLVLPTALIALSLTLSLTNVRFDYYRRAAGELSRMGRDEAALDLYRKAERHAPGGQSRRAKIEELEQRVFHKRTQ